MPGGGDDDIALTATREFLYGSSQQFIVLQIAAVLKNAELTVSKIVHGFFSLSFLNLYLS